MKHVTFGDKVQWRAGAPIDTARAYTYAVRFEKTASFSTLTQYATRTIFHSRGRYDKYKNNNNNNNLWDTSVRAYVYKLV